MNFLKCLPSVFVIGNEYELLLTAKANGVFCVKIGGKTFYEENTGVLSSEKNFTKIRIPQQILNREKSYTVSFRETIIRRAYFSQFKEEESIEFKFKPIEKKNDIHIYHVADVHYHFDIAKKTCEYFGDDVDLFIVNGDIGEVETEENYFEVCRFVGDISRGEVPVLFVRGNHDTRGKLAEKFTDYFPANNKKTYYTFSVGCLQGVAIDCGEDKLDCNPEYGGVNTFEIFRKEEAEYLKTVEFTDTNKITFAVGHFSPSLTTSQKGSIFDNDHTTYEAMAKELERMKLRFMVIGHFHQAFILNQDDERNQRPHSYPIVVGSAIEYREYLWGTAFILNQDGMEVLFTDQNKEVKEKYSFQFDKA